MITYINSTNANKYSSLFSEAEEILANYWLANNIGDPEDKNRFGPKVDGVYTHGINSLNTYFSWIGDLVNIGTGTFEINRGQDEEGNDIIDKVDYDGMKFSILPLDEDVFTIDANTRHITVPTSFANNGISVQSDEISEVVYFKVDRFYDATDLYMQDIMIEWKAPNGDKGYSVPTVKILDDTANYVIFGWALSSKITSKSGNITFAVRFYEYDQELGQIKYSLSTLTQTAKIMPNIDLDIASLLRNDGILEGYVVIKDSANVIAERAQNSQTGNSGDKAVEPETKDEFFSVDPTNTHAPYVVVLQLADGSYAAHVTGSGYSSDAGTISYIWKKYTYDKGERIQIKSSDNPLSFSDAYTKFSLADAKAMHEVTPELMFYIYQGIDENVPSYKVIADIDALTEDTTPEVYRKDTKCTFDGVGYYILAIQNRKGSSTTTHNTDPFVVYPPCVPTMDDSQNGGTAFLDGEDKEKSIEVKYSVNNKPDIDPAFATLTNDYTKYGYKDTNDADAAPSTKYAFDPAEEKVTFEWHCKKLDESEYAPVANASAAVLTPADEGDYFCRLAGQLNGETSDSIDSKVWHVAYLPAHAVYSVAGKAPADNGDISIQTDKDLVLKDEMASDKTVASYTLYVTGQNDAKMELRYNLQSMQTSSDGTDRKHQLTDSIEIQRYCYELQRDTATGHTTGTPDREDAIRAKMGEYIPTKKASALYPADVIDGDPQIFSIEDLKAINVDDNGFVKLEEVAPAKDGYYFWLIKNTYNGKELTVSTPLIYFDSPLD